MIRVYLLDDMTWSGMVCVILLSAKATSNGRRVRVGGGSHAPHPRCAPDVAVLDRPAARRQRHRCMRDSGVDPTIQALILTSYEDERGTVRAIMPARGVRAKQIKVNHLSTRSAGSPPASRCSTG